MKFRKLELLTDIFNYHEEVRDIKNVVIEDINIEFGHIPILLVCCYEMNEILKNQRIEIYMLISDVRYKDNKEMEIVYSLVTHSDHDYDIDTSCVEKYEKLTKSHCPLCSDKLNKYDTDGYCSMHHYISQDKIETITTNMSEIKLTLFNL